MKTIGLARGAKRVLAAALLMALGACATPDVAPFAEKTGVLKTMTDLQLKEMSDQIVLAQAENTAITQQDVNRYRESQKLINGLLGQLDKYAKKLNALAKESETGSEAAEQIASTINGFGELAELAVPGARVLTAPVQAGLQLIIEAVNNYQINTSLAAATEEAEPVLEHTVSVLTVLLQECPGPKEAARLKEMGKPVPVFKKDCALWSRATINIAAQRVNALKTGEVAKILAFSDSYKLKRGEMYSTLGTQVESAGSLTEMFDCENLRVNDKKLSPCIPPSDMPALVMAEERYLAVQPIVLDVAEKSATYRNWAAKSNKNAALIVKALQAWLKEHSKIKQAAEDGTTVQALELDAILASIKDFK